MKILDIRSFLPEDASSPISFELALKNCKFVIEENRENDKLIRIESYLTKKSFKWKFSNIWLTLYGNNFLIEAISEKKELKNCDINVKVPKAYQYGAISIHCLDNCVVISNLPRIEVETCVFRSENTFHLNLR